MNLSITISDEQVKALEARLGPATTRQAVYQAVSRTTRAGAGIIRRRVIATLDVDPKYINRVVTTFVANSMDKADATGHIVVSPELIPLVGYGDHRAGTQGTSTVITQGRLPLWLKHSFYATVGKGGHMGIFMRAKGRDKSGGKIEKNVYRALRVGRYDGGTLTKGGYARRFPIEEQFGPSIVDAIGEEKLTEMGNEIMEDMEASLEKNLQSQLSRFLGGSAQETADEGVGMNAEAAHA